MLFFVLVSTTYNNIELPKYVFFMNGQKFVCIVMTSQNWMSVFSFFLSLTKELLKSVFL